MRFWLASCLAMFTLLVSVAAVAQEIPLPPLPERQGNVAYLLRATQQQVLRYDLAQRQWLAPVAIDAGATAFASTSTHLYIAYGRRIERRSLAGGDVTHVINVSGDVDQLLVDGNLLFVLHPTSNGYGTIVSVALGSLARIDAIEHYYDFGGAVVDRANDRIFSLRPATSPNDVRRITYDGAGQFGEIIESPYHGDYALGQRLWLYPDGTRLVSAGGNIFHAEDLSHALSFGVAITDVSFLGNDIPIVLADDRVLAFDNGLRRTGERSLAHPAFALALHGGQVFAFQESADTAGAVVVEHFALSVLSPASPGQPISPVGLRYRVDDAAVDANGVAYLLSNAYRSVFRWDIAAQRYLGTLPLAGPTKDIEIADRTRRLYLLGSYGHGNDPYQRIHFLDLTAASPQPQAFATAPAQYLERVVAMESELVVMESYAAAIHAPDGSRIATLMQCCYTGLQFYDAARRYLYIGNGRHQYLGNGQFVMPGEQGVGYSEPLGISHDGRVLVDAQGIVYDSATRRQVDALSNDVVRARWMTDNTLFTARTPQNIGTPWEPEYASETTIQRWGARYALERELVLDGAFADTLVHGQHLLVITYLDGAPSFTRLDRNLQVVAPDVLAAPVLATEGYTAVAVALRWSDVAGEAGYAVERQDPGSATWRALASVPANRLYHMDMALADSGVYRYRVIARNGARLSAPSNVIEVDLSGSDVGGALPGSTDFVADAMALASDGRLYLLSREHEQLFVWSTRHQRWEASIALIGAPMAMSRSSAADALYLQYDDGGITAMNLRAQTPREVAFVDAGAPCGLVATDAGALLCNDGNVWSGHVVRSLDVVGRDLGETYYSGVTLERALWAQATRTLFAATGTYEIHRLRLQDDGGISPSSYWFSSGVQDDVEGFRVSPSGDTLVLRSGRVHAVSDDGIVERGMLPGPLVDAAWRSGRMYSALGTTLSAHDDDDSARTVATLPSPAQSLASLPNGRLLVAMVEDEARMRFALFDANDVPVPEAILSDDFE